MNFYKHYIGDFKRDTGHMSLTERGAYLALMHHYYATEVPLPKDHSALCRIAGAITKQEQAAVKVAMSFFEQADSGLMHSRIEAEIEKAGQRADTNRRIAEEREERRRVARNEHESCTKREPNQTPDTRQELEPASAGLSPAAPDDAPAAGDANGEQPQQGRPPCPHERIVAAYHEILPELRQVREWNETRRRLLGRRWSESHKRQSLDWWREFFGYVRKSDFLMGKTTGRDGRPFDCDLEWLIRPVNFAKVVEGKYE